MISRAKFQFSRSRKSFVAAGILAFVAVIWCTGKIYGWGTGHETQLDMVMEVLPAEIKDFFPDDVKKEMRRNYVHYPDSVIKFDEKLLGLDALEILKRYKIKGGGELHDSMASASVCFLLLQKAFKEKNPVRSSVWLGSLVHVIGDCGCHLPLSAYVSEIARFTTKKRNTATDLSALESDEQGRKALKKVMAGFTPAAPPDDPNDLFKKLLMMGHESSDTGAQYDSRVAGIYNLSDKPETIEDSVLALAEVGAIGAKLSADVIVAAWEYAKKDKPVELSEDLIKKAQLDVNNFLATKPIEHDTVYAGTLDSHAYGPCVGVLVAPSTLYGWTCFGYIQTVSQAMIMRQFKAAGVPYIALDTRKVEKDGLPTPEKMPLLVVCAGGFNCNLAPYKKYCDAGGKMLWIAGRDHGLLGKLSAALKPMVDNLGPVSKGYEDANLNVVAKVSISFSDELQNALGKEPFKFVNNPNLKGWETPHCNLQIMADEPAIKVLATVSDGKDSMHIGAALIENSKARHIFLPEYLLVPFVLSKDDAIDFSKPTLDSFGKKIVMSSIKMLVPELVK